MKKTVLTTILFFPFFLSAQNLPQCDSLVIDCCDFGNNTLTITVSNPSTELFGYPGFVLFNSSMDTIAKESVTYFGISQNGQPHQMTIVAPLILPFTGYLNLYSEFYDSLDCSFAFTIADTLTSVNELENNFSGSVFPNPSSESFFVQMNKQYPQLTIRVIDVLGKIISNTKIENTNSAQLLIEIPGVYILEISNDIEILNRQKLIRR